MKRTQSFRTQILAGLFLVLGLKSVGDVFGVPMGNPFALAWDFVRVSELVTGLVALLSCVCLLRGHDRAPAAVMVWSTLVAASLLYPPTPIERVSLATQVAVWLFMGALLLGLNVTVRRELAATEPAAADTNSG